MFSEFYFDLFCVENFEKAEQLVINNNKEILNFYKKNPSDSQKNLVNQSTNTTFLVEKDFLGNFMKKENNKIPESKNLVEKDFLGNFMKKENNKIPESKYENIKNQQFEKIQPVNNDFRQTDNITNMKTTGTDPETYFPGAKRNLNNLQSFKDQDENLLKNNEELINDNINNDANNFLEESFRNSEFLTKNSQMIAETQNKKQISEDFSIKNQESSHFEIKGSFRQDNSFQKSQPNSFVLFNNQENLNESILSSMKISINQENNMIYSQNINNFNPKISNKNDIINSPQINENLNMKFSSNPDQNSLISPNLIQNFTSVHISEISPPSYNNDNNMINPKKTPNYSNFDKENCSFHSNLVKPSKNPSPKIKKDRKTQNHSTYFMRNDFLNSVKKRPFSQNVEFEEMLMEPEKKESGKESLAIPKIKFEKEKYKGDSDSSEDVII